ncbi:MAG: hypothetical protein GF350_11795, partial [Chitinivibrionales bacterium]|nr:hypothetical protein [Chitinivibrionales bacterium]
IPVIIARVYENAAATGKNNGPRMTNQQPSNDSVVELAPEKDPSKNAPAVICAIEGAPSAGSRIVLLGTQKNTFSFAYNNGMYTLSLQPKRIPLPLSIKLVDFIKEDYAGTDMARDYKSRIYASGENLDREVVVSMNRPFRYKAFTFFQSSYSQEGNREASTFAVVENPARQLPYIASFLIMAGLLVHFCIQLIAGIRHSQGNKR